MRNQLPVVFWIFVSFALTCAAQEKTASNPPAALPVQISTLSGRVIRQANGEGLREAQVVIQNTTNEKQIYNTRSDGRGEFSFANVLPGTYRLKAKHYGFAPQRYESALVIRAGEAIKDITVRLVADAVVMGTVVDEQGEPIPGIEVHVLRADKRQSAGGDQSLQTARFSVTNDLGEYRVFGLTPGEYYVTAVDTGSRDIASYSGEAEPAEPQKPIYPPTFYPGTNQKREASAVELKPGEETRVDFKLLRTRTVSVSGVVTLPGRRPAVDTQVTLEDGAILTGQQRAVRADRSGHFVIPNVFAGSYTILATQTAKDDVLTSREKIEVGEQDVSQVELLLSAGKRISGRVYVHGSGADFSAHPAIVWLRAVDGLENGFSAGEVRGDGSFLLMPEIGEDTYTLEMSDLPEGFYLKEARYGTQDALEKGITISNRATPEKLILTLCEGAAQLNGRLTQDGVPLGGATLEAVNETGSHAAGPVVSTTTDEKGAFQFTGLPPGRYQIIKPSENRWMDKQERVAASVVLSQGDRKQLDLMLGKRN